jgi:multiple sugar transport system substrate-binding protein
MMRRSSGRAARRRSASVAVLSTLAVLLLAACSGGSGGGQSLSEKPVTLRFTWWGSDDRDARTEQAIKLFEKAHPKITVKGEFKEWNGYWDSLATTVAANDAPDIIQMDELYLASYAERGALLDLDTAKKYLNTADFDAKALATGELEGKAYGLPTGLTAYSIVVNTDLLDKYKIALPDDSTWTWDDLKRVGAEVSKASGGKVRGIASWGFDTGGLNIWARQAGASLYDEKGNVAIPPAVLADFWTYLADLAKSGVAPPASVTDEQSSGALEQGGIPTRTAAFGTCWSSQLASLSAVTPGAHLKLLKLPTRAATATPSVYYKPSMFWSISSRSKHPAEAELFVNFLANSDQAATAFLTDRGVPANTRTRDVITAKLSGADADSARYLDALAVGGAPRPTPNGASNIEAILRRHTEDVLFGRATPQKAATSFISELQAEIDAA